MPRRFKTLPRLFVQTPLVVSDILTLEREQSNYLANVLRKKLGDAVVLFNGADGAFRGEISEAGRKAVTLELVEQIATQPKAPDFWYGFAPLKSARLDYMVQKATEMGVGVMQPVMTHHTQVSRLKIDRMRVNAIEAAEQCEVLHVPEVREEIGLEPLLADWKSLHGERMLVLADEAAASASPIAVLEQQVDRPLGLLIGPEGGFSDQERALLLAQSFVVPISLGPRILRADTAAVAALAVMQSIIGDWR